MSDIETAAAIQLLVRRILPESLRVSVKKARAELTEKQKRAALSLKYQKEIEKMTESKQKIDKFRKITEQFDRDVRIAQAALEFLLAIAEQKGIDLENTWHSKFQHYRRRIPTLQNSKNSSKIIIFILIIIIIAYFFY
ncbi:hypothetical protein GCK72_003903 [Caenorhabditis remanei]|uniref:Uncharacterized protein n=1 Tax=Caenorhabditis remanei TaxID=31234 RepID=A0A6A5H9R0_CAERE|nr:hypothetical protein GCK72_003903 [Caenorhabditis remanei]KAF1763957.1 hypothetical protein GCK72_003903 [Caenorhabditis remanei]